MDNKSEDRGSNVGSKGNKSKEEAMDMLSIDGACEEVSFQLRCSIVVPGID